MSAPDDAATEDSNATPERQRLEKQPFLSGGLSLLIAGVGQIYNGQYLRGIGFILALLLIMLVTQTVPRFSLAASALGLLVHAVAAYDAYAQAQRINEEAQSTR